MEQTATECVYLLVNTDGKTFKIGKSINTLARMKSFDEKVDLEKSLEIVCPAGTAHTTEKILHRMFREDQAEMAMQSGYTEWFSLDCFDEVLDFVKSHQKRLKYLSIDKITIPVPPPKKAPAKPKVPRIKLTDEERLEMLKKLDVENLPLVQHMEKWLAEITAAGIVLGTYRHNDETTLVLKGFHEAPREIDCARLHWERWCSSSVFSEKLITETCTFMQAHFLDFAEPDWIASMDSVIALQKLFADVPKLEHPDVYIALRKKLDSDFKAAWQRSWESCGTEKIETGRNYVRRAAKRRAEG